MKDGGPAFPRPAFGPQDATPEECEINDSQKGMTLRDYFAGQALAGFIGNSDLVDLMQNGFAPIKGAEAAYLCADAMIEARSK